MTTDPTTDREAADAEQVGVALQALSTGNLDEAESLLLGVIANTPAEYSNVAETEEAISIKFWDQASFIHYVTWRQDQGLARKDINCISNAYPCAHYYMGFLCVKRKQIDRAIEYLDKGLALEPTNPKFKFEKAQAMVHAGRHQEALALYDQVTEVTEHVSANDLAVTRRGRGFVLIEMGDLDRAETEFRSSLELDPDNEIALNELAYIHHLRQGGATSHSESVQTTGRDPSICVVCGQSFDHGVIVSVNGIPVSICKRCDRKLTKKWWQFWK